MLKGFLPLLGGNDESVAYLLSYCGVEYETDMQESQTYFSDGETKVEGLFPTMRFICRKYRPELLG